jgi:lipopolysaccharide export system protein LptA
VRTPVAVAWLLGLLAAGAVAGAVDAQQASQASSSGAADLMPNIGNMDTGSAGAPIDIEADDGIEWRRDENVYIARGNAHAARGDISVNADSLIAHYRDNGGGKTQIYLMEADGHVVLKTKDAQIVGDRALYDLSQGSAIVTGKDIKASSKEQFVTARDSLEYWNQQGAVVARGNAVAGQAGREIHADLLTGYFRVEPNGAKKMYQVEATGNVRLLSEGNVARARKLVYNLDTDVAMLEGDVKITRGKNQLDGQRAVYNLKTGQAKITGGGGKVKTLLVPGSGPSAGLSPGGGLAPAGGLVP